MNQTCGSSIWNYSHTSSDHNATSEELSTYIDPSSTQTMVSGKHHLYTGKVSNALWRLV